MHLVSLQRYQIASVSRVSMENSKLHVAILSSPGKGQVIPLLVLGNRLAKAYDTIVTLIVPQQECQFVKSQSLSDCVNVIGAPLVDISAKISPSMGMVAKLCMSMRESVPNTRAAIASMKHRPDALIMDFFCSSALSIAREFEMPAYLCMTTNAWATAVFMYSPVWDKEVEGQYVDQKEALNIPGCKGVQPEDMADPMLDRNSVDYEEYLGLGIASQNFDGILINTWDDLEPASLAALRGNEVLRLTVKMPVYSIGPLIRPVEPDALKGEMLEWLERQAVESVLFISFGSAGVLSAEQTTELAFGLERSQQRFIWAVRPPFDAALNSSADPDAFLPDGFLERTRDVGFVVQNWAQQVEILNHPAIGGFISHCGWNSTMETIAAGVPMIAWPLYAEQKQNATMLSEEIGVAIRPEVAPNERVVGKEEIEKTVRKVMQGEEAQRMRGKLKKLKFSADNTLSNRGSSFNSLLKALEDLRSQISKSSMYHI